VWRLSDQAIRDGKILPTTRYRYAANRYTGRGRVTKPPAPERQRSGALGGVAARRSARNKSRKLLHDATARKGRLRSAPARVQRGHTTPASSVVASPSTVAAEITNLSAPSSPLPLHGLPQMGPVTTTQPVLNAAAYAMSTPSLEGCFTYQDYAASTFDSLGLHTAQSKHTAMGQFITPQSTMYGRIYHDLAPVGLAISRCPEPCHISGTMQWPQGGIGSFGYSQQQAMRLRPSNLVQTAMQHTFTQPKGISNTNHILPGTSSLTTSTAKPAGMLFDHCQSVASELPFNYPSPHYYHYMEQPIHPNSNQAEPYFNTELVAVPQTPPLGYSLIGNMLAMPALDSAIDNTIDPSFLTMTNQKSNDNDELPFGAMDGI